MYKVNLTKTPKATVTSTPSTAPKSRVTPTTTTLKDGAVSAYTACRECGKRFTQKNPTARFRALAKHYYNGCND